MTEGPNIEVGRGDLAELARRAGKSLKRDQEARKREGPAKPVEGPSLCVVAYPVGWNHLAQIVEWECCTDTKVKPFNSYLRSRGPTVESAKKRMRWVLVKALVQLAELPLENAKDIARRATVMLLDTLPEQPKEMRPV